MTIRELLNFATKNIQSTSPTLDAEVLLAHVLKKPKAYLLVNLESRISNLAKNKFIKLIKKRAIGWPVAYLTNRKEFFGLDFYVDRNVLIPRPETEGLVELVLEKIKNQKSKIKILDIGTGSGCIAVSLAYNLSPITYNLFASDISPDALKIAKLNARRHKVKITFRQGDLFTPWANQNFDIIVANLPYLSHESHPSTKFEPKKALIAKNHGLALIEKLFKQISTLTAQPSSIFLEIGKTQGTEVKKLAAKWLPAYEIKIVKDLSGKDRYAILEI